MGCHSLLQGIGIKPRSPALQADSFLSEPPETQFDCLYNGDIWDFLDGPMVKTVSFPQMYRTDFWTLWEKARMGCLERAASKRVHYQG